MQLDPLQSVSGNSRSRSRGNEGFGWEKKQSFPGKAWWGKCGRKQCLRKHTGYFQKIGECSVSQ